MLVLFTGCFADEAYGKLDFNLKVQNDKIHDSNGGGGSQGFDTNCKDVHVHVVQHTISNKIIIIIQNQKDSRFTNVRLSQEFAFFSSLCMLTKDIHVHDHKILTIIIIRAL